MKYCALQIEPQHTWDLVHSAEPCRHIHHRSHDSKLLLRLATDSGIIQMVLVLCVCRMHEGLRGLLLGFQKAWESKRCGPKGLAGESESMKLKI